MVMRRIVVRPWCRSAPFRRPDELHRVDFGCRRQHMDVAEPLRRQPLAGRPPECGQLPVDDRGLDHATGASHVPRMNDRSRQVQDDRDAGPVRSPGAKEEALSRGAPDIRGVDNGQQPRRQATGERPVEDREGGS